LILVKIKINKQIKETKGTVVRRHFEGYAKLFVNLTLELCCCPRSIAVLVVVLYMYPSIYPVKDACNSSV
jgi:hypothetical protein